MTTSLHLYNSRSAQKSRRLRGERLAADVQGFERRTVEEPKVIYIVGNADAGAGSSKSVPFCGCSRVCTRRSGAVEGSDVERHSAKDPPKQERLQPQAGATSGKDRQATARFPYPSNHMELPIMQHDNDPVIINN